jgi:IclR family mhp operon transcriptional activator
MARNWGVVMDERQEVKSLKKALRALTFLNCNGESTVTEVACAIGVPRTTSYRLLETLASEGYVEKQPHSHIYRLTSMVQKLSSGFGDSDLVVEVAKPLINRIGGEVRWPLALATPVGGDMMVRIATDFDTPLAIDRYIIGFRTPMLHAPAGLAYLAFCTEAERETILDLIKRSGETFETSCDPFVGLEYKLEQIQRQGFCHIRFAQYREAGLGVPLFADGRVVGGIVMRYIKSTMKGSQLEEHYAPIVRQLAVDIAQAYEHRLDLDRSEAEPDSPVHTIMAHGLAATPVPFAMVGRSASVPHAPEAFGVHRALR